MDINEAYLQKLRVRVYWNLRKKVYSVQYKGKVIGHLNNLTLKDVKPIIQKAGQLKTRQTGRKRVHAYIEGIITSYFKDPKTNADGLQERNVINALIYMYPDHRVSYNPYKDDTFVSNSENDMTGKHLSLWILADHPVIFHD